MGELEEIAVADFGAADEIGELLVQPRTVPEKRGFVRQTIGLSKGRAEAPSGKIGLPVEAVGQPHTVFDPVISGEAVEREEIGVL